jgi:3-hydroxymyristoyl/3-hydroxydecanoyl-(acyl carrier protein) dehydratase
MTPPRSEVMQAGPDAVRLELCLDGAHPAFRGHFPGMPVLACVIQLDWALQLARLYLGVLQPAATDFQVRCSRLIVPDHALQLALRVNRARHRLEFAYWLDGERASAGHIRLDPA